MKLSRLVRRLRDEPIVYAIGDMYFRLNAPGFMPRVQYVRVPGRGRRLTNRRLLWWMRHLMFHTEAREIDVLHPRHP